MDGRALTATELSYVAGVTPQTTSAHLAKLMDGGLIAMAAQGRHRYYRLAGPDVARLLESIMVIAGGRPSRPKVRSRSAEQIRAARTCYDHFAGRLGVGLTQAMLARGYLEDRDPDFALTAAGRTFLDRFGIDTAAASRPRRAFARQCLDWSERTPHLAGALGAALAAHCFESGLVRRHKGGRGVTVTEAGRETFAQQFGLRRVA